MTIEHRLDMEITMRVEGADGSVSETVEDIDDGQVVALREACDECYAAAKARCADGEACAMHEDRVFRGADL